MKRNINLHNITINDNTPNSKSCFLIISQSINTQFPFTFHFPFSIVSLEREERESKREIECVCG